MPSLPPDDTPDRAERLASRIQQQLLQGPVRATWGAQAAALVNELLQTPVADLLDDRRVRSALRASLAEPAVERWTLPLVRRCMALVMTRLSARAELAEQFVPEGARRSLDALVARPDVVPAAIVQEVMRDPAVEEVLRDVLFEALRQFSQSASPFTAEWGLPALLKRMPPFGAAPIRKAIESMRVDFEKRLEPEIRKFLAGFSKRAARRATELSLRKQQEPEFVALRQRVVGALLKRELGELVWPPDDPRGELLVATAVETVGHVLAHEVLQQELETLLELALETFGERTLGEALDELGIELPDVEQVADAYWPLAERVLASATLGSALEEAVAAAFADEAEDD